MTEQKTALLEATIRQHCKTLHLPTIASQFQRLAEQAIKANMSHEEYLEGNLAGELEERERRTVQRRIQDARFPRLKTLDEFDFTQTQKIPASKIRKLADGSYIDQAEPIVLIGDCGTGKTHLATGLCVEACRQKRRARFTTATALVNELVEAKQENRLGRALTRWQRYAVIAIDELGYVPLAEIGAEFLYQIIADRTEKVGLIITTNLPFSEWTQVFPNTRLCKAVVDRVTDRAHILDTGTDSYRFHRTLASRKKKSSGGEDK